MKNLAKFLLVLLVLSPTLTSGQKKLMTPETLWEFGRVSDVQVSPDGAKVLYGVTFFDVAENRGTRDLFVIPARGGTPVNITNSSTSEGNARWRPDGKKIGFLRGGQIWEMNPDGGNQLQISNYSGSISGFGYSPDLNKVFFSARIRVKPTVNQLYPDLPKANALLYDDLMYRHWDHWKDGTYSHIFVADYSVESGVGTYTHIMKDEPYDSPPAPFGGTSYTTWSPDGRYLFYTSKKKTGKEYALSTNSHVYRYDTQTGITEELTTFNRGYDRNPSISPCGNFMAWESMHKDGFESDKNRIMIMDLRSRKYRDFSAGFDQSSSGMTWSAEGSKLFFISGKHATYQIYELNVADASIRQLTTGIHDYQSVNVAGDYLVALRMSMSMPSEIFRLEKTNAGVNQIQLTFVNKPVLDNLHVANVEKRWVKTTDDKDMLVWVIYPPGFDRNKKYPALLFCGGGPQSAISQFFSYRWNFQMMAAKGYIVVAPNRRGLPTFGQEWNDQISLDYGGQNKKDLLRAIDAVAAEPFVDNSRLGAVGASYGGFSVFWLAGNHQKRFGAFVAHCGMFNFKSWYGTTEEMFFANHDLGGPYWETPRPHSYDFSPHHFVGNWDTPLLVIHGLKDFRVPYGQGMEAFNAAQLKGIPSRFLAFPEENHWVLTPQNSILWQREFFRWLDQWLK